jgi:hypothetical protein
MAGFININTECQWTQLLHKDNIWQNWIKKENTTISYLQEIHLIDKNKHWQAGRRFAKPIASKNKQE